VPQPVPDKVADHHTEGFVVAFTRAMIAGLIGAKKGSHAAKMRARSESLSGAGLVKARSEAQGGSAEECSGVKGCGAMPVDFGSATRQWVDWEG